MPHLSIITVCLNNRSGLEKTIDSVFKQTYSDYEYIVIDGASTDGSAELLNSYRNQLVHAVSEKDKGVYDAMNKGIRLARGTYCQFLNAGDTFFENDTLKKVFERNCNEDILYGNMIIYHQDGRKQLGKMPSILSFRQMMRDTLWHPVSFIKRDLFEKAGLYNLEFKIAADYDFFVNVVLFKKVSLYYLNQTIAVFKFDGMSSLSSNKDRLASERRIIQLKYFNEADVENALKLTTMEKMGDYLKKWRRWINI